MDIKVNKIDSANAKAEAKVSNTFLEEKKNKIAKDISKNIEIRGFRKGKVPITVVKSRYKERIEQDSKSQALKDLLDEAIKMLEVEQNSIIGEPWVVRFDTEDDGLDIEKKWYDILKTVASECGAKVIFVNRVGFEDGLGFWGGSCVLENDARIIEQLPHYKKSIKTIGI